MFRRLLAAAHELEQEHEEVDDDNEGDRDVPVEALAEVPDGDLVVLRVYGTEGPVLSDIAYAARRQSLGTALAP